jgi:hypothetical protein
MDGGEIAEMAEQRRRSADVFDLALTYFKLQKST